MACPGISDWGSVAGSAVAVWAVRGRANCPDAVSRSDSVLETTFFRDFAFVYLLSAGR